jgi:hypothetical protein
MLINSASTNHHVLFLWLPNTPFQSKLAATVLLPAQKGMFVATLAVNKVFAPALLLPPALLLQ